MEGISAPSFIFYLVIPLKYAKDFCTDTIVKHRGWNVTGSKQKAYNRKGKIISLIIKFNINVTVIIGQAKEAKIPDKSKDDDDTQSIVFECDIQKQEDIDNFLHFYMNETNANNEGKR